ncbi:MAG: asparagine synthase (glutamine-hydrolyzing), partial [Myxococcota bacterium]
MCGLTGFLKHSGSDERDLEAELRAMTASLAHRGPDDEQFHSDPGAGLYMGFRRLAIQDLSEAGRQPMHSASGRFVLTFNGEVYNFASLRDELRAGGATFRGGSDTEVLLAAFESWGVEAALARFEGMFAIALWDTAERKLHLARDRIGIKPLYYLFRDGALAWASEVRAFIRCPLFANVGNSESALRFLQRLYVPAPHSILEGVDKLPPGELLTVEWPTSAPPSLQRRAYWELSAIANAPPLSLEPDELVDALHATLRNAVAQRLVADVPVGAFLSGGIDSSLIVALMQEASSTPVRTFTVGFSEAPHYNEAEVAEAVAAVLRERVHVAADAVHDGGRLGRVHGLVVVARV